jgi:hypothetical protein
MVLAWYMESSPTALTTQVVDLPSLPGAMTRTLGDLVDSIAALDRMEASIAGYKAELVEQARIWSELIESGRDAPDARGWNAEVRARRVLAAELSCALRIPERSAENLVETSRLLVDRLPQTLRALSEGAISWRHARVLVDHACSLDPSFAGAFEEAVLPFAKKLTVAKFDRKARAERERVHPESIEVRHETALSKRSLDLQPAEDGMGYLTAYLPIVTAQGIYNRLTDLGMRHKSAAESRTLTQLRVDFFAELLLAGRLDEGRDGGIRARVLVTVPVLALLGHGLEPAVLEGYGPIDRETALALAAHAPSFTRLLTHPETGAVLSVGRDSYAVPKDLRTWLRVRDGTCRFPGCSRAARNCDIDHTADWQHGNGTDHDNLAHLCPAHHHLKHQTAWAVEQTDDGVLEWTSPNGRKYTTEPETKLAS